MARRYNLLDHESNEMDVTSSNLEKVLRGCERILGVEEHDLPKLVPRSKSNLVGWASSYNSKKRQIEAELSDSEHNIFHECVHYSMHQDNLLMTETVADDAPLLEMVYAHLIDETIAEFATYGVWGYNPEEVGVPVENELADALIDNDNLERIEDLVLSLGESPFLNTDYWTAIRVVAIQNAKALQVEPSELVNAIKDAQERYSSPIEIYQAIRNLNDLQPQL